MGLMFEKSELPPAVRGRPTREGEFLPTIQKLQANPNEWYQIWEGPMPSTGQRPPTVQNLARWMRIHDCEVRVRQNKAEGVMRVWGRYNTDEH